MFRTSLALFLAVFQLRGLAFELSVVESDPVPFNTGVAFKWTAGATDPTHFTVEVWADEGPFDQFFDTITRDPDQTSGSGTFPALTFPGLHYIAGVGSDGSTLDTIHFEVVTSSSSSAATHDTTKSTSMTGTLSVTLKPVKPSQAVQSQDPNVSSFTTSDTSTSTSASSSVGATPLKPNHIPIIVGGALGGLAALSLVICGILLLRRRRARLSNDSAAPYELTIRPRSPNSQGVFAPQKPSTHHIPSRISGSGVPLMEMAPSIHSQIQEINRWSEGGITNIPDDSSEFRTENVRLKAENQVLRNLIASDWALRVVNATPPSYPNSEPMSE
ncbi:hypothetical protein C8J56DRAFT_1158379 [Mycena floridula]|nr:hypothetical protein C8J56DRAFT_1158379 [Mycena floridula]